MKFLKTLAFFSLTLILLSGIYASFAASTEWTGNTSTDWGDPANWSGTPPSSSTQNLDIFIPSSPNGGRYPVLSDGTYLIKLLTVEFGATLTQTGGLLILKSGLSIQSGSPLGKYSQFDGTLELQKPFNNEGIFYSTGGLVRFSPSASGGIFEGINQFFHLEIDNGVKPDFDNADYNNILIAGNFNNNNPSLDITSKATFTFNGSGDQTIYSATSPLPAKTTFGNLIIDKPSGTLKLLSDISVETAFTPTQGYLDLNGQILYVNGEVYEGPLPVELSSFSSVILENGIKLKWRTETEVSNYGFEILRSGQNDKWDLLGFVEGHGNSNSPKEYSFVDKNLSAGKYSYKLKQLDTDGKFEFSKTIEIEFGTVQKFELNQNYPNPFNPSTTIKFSLSESNFINLSIFNSLGEKVEELVDEVKEPGIYTVEFNAKNYPSGIFLYRIQSDNFTSTKKMILVK